MLKDEIKKSLKKNKLNKLKVTCNLRLSFIIIIIIIII
jgi:hypothetical protein